MINRTNPDDIFLRSATISLMKYLEDNMVIEQVENGKIVEYPVPVFYNKAQDSQFMRDYFTQYSTSCHNIEYADGDYDREPFATVTMESFTVKTSDMTNKFVRGSHVVEEEDENGLLVSKGYSSMLYCLPMGIKYNVNIRCEDSIQAFRIVQSILDGVFKNGVIHFDYRGQRIRCNASLDSSISRDVKVEFQWTDDQKQDIKFSVDVEAYYPVFDKTTTLFRGNIIRNFRNFIDQNKRGIVAKSTVVKQDGDMKVYGTTALLDSDMEAEYKSYGYSKVLTSDIDKETKEKIESSKGPFIQNDKEYLMVKWKQEEEN